MTKRMKDPEWQGWIKHPPQKPLAAAVANDCPSQKLVRGIDYCTENDKWLCRALVEQGRCPRGI